MASSGTGNAVGREIINDELIYDAPAGEAGVLSIVGPDAYKGRKAVIDQGAWESTHYYKRSHWRITFNRLPTWRNQLMGWNSNADPLHALHDKFKFETKEAAIKFCISHGIEFEVDEPENPLIKMGEKDYADNFLSNYTKSQIAKHGKEHFTYGGTDRQSAWANLDSNKFGSASWDEKESRWRKWKGGNPDKNYSAVAGAPHPRDR